MTTSITASALRAAISVGGPNSLQKTDLTLLLEYVVENIIKNPITQDDLEQDLYHKPMTRFAGFDIKVENPRGTYRSGVDQQGTPWKNLMSNTYGEFMSTMAVDGDPVDVFLGDRQDCQDVFIVHQAQKDNWDVYDEDKVMLGFMSMEEALTAYLRHYNGDKRFIMQVTVMSRPVFKAKLLNCHNGLLTDFRG
jgi:hypothetical protein